VYLQELKES